MITELYTFSPGSYVVADEWNANFSTLFNVAGQHSEAITDAYNLVAFYTSDLSLVYARVDVQQNSYSFSGTALEIKSPNVEYWQNRVEEITDSQELVVTVGHINGEARVIFRTSTDRSLTPVTVNYAGGAENINFIDDSRVWQEAGTKVLFFYESNNKLNVRMAKAG